jgi:hypothetical protein
MRPVRLFLIFMVLSAGRLFAQNSTTATVFRPSITSISPQSLTTGADSTLLSIRGNLFQRGATVFFNGRKVDITRSEGDSLLVVVIPGALTANPDIATLLVENPDQTKIGLRVVVRALFSQLGFSSSPSSTLASVSAFTLVITGTGFAGRPRIFLGGAEIRLISTSNTQLAVEVPGSLNIGGTYAVQVVQNGSTVFAGILTIIPRYIPPPPAITRVSPSVLPSGGGTITITGVSFSTVAVVRLGSRQLIVTSISDNRITAIVPPVSVYAIFLLSVTNPDGQVASQQLQYVNSVSNTLSATTLSPNPATSTLTLETALDRASTLVLAVRNILGERVLEERHDAASGRFAATLDVSGLASGVYLLEASNGTARWSQKFVKH